MKKEDDTPFAGFPLPKKNFFSMPNEIINIISNITNMAELKVIIYVIRHTWGFHEYGICKTISTDEFMRGRRKQDGTRMDQGTGLSNRSVIDGLRSAVEHGYLVCEIDTSDIARTVKSYTLKMATPCEESSQGEEPSYPPCEESSQEPMKNLHTAYEEPSQRSEKDTKERHLKKDSIEERESTPAHSDANASAHSPSLSSEQNGLQRLIEDKAANKPTTPPLPSKQSVNKQQPTLLDTPLAEPDMHGAWDNDKVVQYAEWCNGYRYQSSMRKQQLKAAQDIHERDKSLTLDMYRQAYDERNDAWWKEHHRGKLHVIDMRAKGKSGLDRVSEMLLRIEDDKQMQAVKAASRANNRTVQPSKRTPTLSQGSAQSLRSLVPPLVPSREEAKKEIV